MPGSILANKGYRELYNKEGLLHQRESHHERLGYLTLHLVSIGQGQELGRVLVGNGRKGDHLDLIGDIIRVAGLGLAAARAHLPEPAATPPLFHLFLLAAVIGID